MDPQVIQSLKFERDTLRDRIQLMPKDSQQRFLAEQELRRQAVQLERVEAQYLHESARP